MLSLLYNLLLISTMKKNERKDMNMNKVMNGTFLDWLKNNERYDLVVAGCTLIVPIITLILNFFSDADNALITSSRYFNFELVLYACHIVFLIFALYSLGRMVIIPEYDIKNKLYQYVANTFDSDSRIVKFRENRLYRAILTTCKQFLYSWLVIWSIWLLMYSNNFIYKLLGILDFNIVDNDYFERSSTLFNNTFNLANSLVFFFIYFVISESSAKETMNSASKKTLKDGLLALMIFIVPILFFDYYSLFCSDYEIMQFYIKLSISIIATVSIIAVLGRLNSSFLLIPQCLIIGLYIYAAIQMLYPFLSANRYINDVISTAHMGRALLLVAFIGKICLYFVIRWIFHNNRFLFYIIHKSNSLYESGRMLKGFNMIVKNDDMLEKVPQKKKKAGSKHAEKE